VTLALPIAAFGRCIAAPDALRDDRNRGRRHGDVGDGCSREVVRRLCDDRGVFRYLLRLSDDEPHDPPATSA